MNIDIEATKDKPEPMNDGTRIAETDSRKTQIYKVLFQHVLWSLSPTRPNCVTRPREREGTREASLPP